MKIAAFYRHARATALTLLSGLLLALGLSVGGASAADNRDPGFESAGVVTAVDLASQTFTLGGQTFKVRQGLRIAVDNDEPILMNILTPGSVITVSGHHSGNQKIVDNVFIHSLGAQ